LRVSSFRWLLFIVVHGCKAEHWNLHFSQICNELFRINSMLHEKKSVAGCLFNSCEKKKKVIREEKKSYATSNFFSSRMTFFLRSVFEILFSVRFFILIFKKKSTGKTSDTYTVWRWNTLAKYVKCTGNAELRQSVPNADSDTF